MSLSPAVFPVTCCRRDFERFPLFQPCMRLHLSLCSSSLPPLLFFFCIDGNGTQGPAPAGQVLYRVTLPTTPWPADASLGPNVSPYFSHLRHCCFSGAHHPTGLHILSQPIVPASTPNGLPPVACHSFTCGFLSAITVAAGYVYDSPSVLVSLQSQQDD